MNSEEDLPVELVVTAARFVRLVRQQAGPEVSVGQWRALVLLAEHGPIRVGDFAALDRLSQPTATAMLRRLVDQGAARRIADPHDARASLVELTALGRERLAALRQQAGRTVAPLLSELSDAERTDLRRSVRLLSALVDASGSRPGTTINQRVSSIE